MSHMTEAMPTIEWHREAQWPGAAAWHAFVDAHGERVELLVYDLPADRLGPRLCGFEVFAGDGFLNQVAAGVAESLEEAKAAALEMIKRPRAAWTVVI